MVCFCFIEFAICRKTVKSWRELEADTNRAGGKDGGKRSVVSVKSFWQTLDVVWCVSGRFG